MKWMSLWQMPQAAIFTLISLAPGAASWISSMIRGFLNLRQTAAFMTAFPKWRCDPAGGSSAELHRRGRIDKSGFDLSAFNSAAPRALSREGVGGRLPHYRRRVPG